MENKVLSIHFSDGVFKEITLETDLCVFSLVLPLQRPCWLVPLWISCIHFQAWPPFYFPSLFSLTSFEYGGMYAMMMISCWKVNV